MVEKIKYKFLNKLFDMDDNSVSATSVFLLATTIIGLILLLVPAITLLVEVFYNHTIATDLSGMAAYIGSVAGLFASAGITKAWTNWSNYKFNKDVVVKKTTTSNQDGGLIVVEETKTTTKKPNTQQLSEGEILPNVNV